MLNLLPETKQLISQLEQLSSRRVEFMQVESLPVLATLNIARNGSPYHILQYRPSNTSLDYFVSKPVTIALRMFEQPKDLRFDFAIDGSGEKELESILRVTESLTTSDEDDLHHFVKVAHHWSLMQLRSIPIGMRVDAWLYESFPKMRKAIRDGLAEEHQMTVNALTQHVGKFSIPSHLFGPATAYALFTDRLLGTGYSIPFVAAGTLESGKLLLEIFDQMPSSSPYDTQLLRAWANQLGMQNWYQMLPYKP